MWIDESELKAAPEAAPATRGRPHAYSDTAIQMPLGIKQVYRPPYFTGVEGHPMPASN